MNNFIILILFISVVTIFGILGFYLIAKLLLKNVIKEIDERLIIIENSISIKHSTSETRFDILDEFIEDANVLMAISNKLIQRYNEHIKHIKENINNMTTKDLKHILIELDAIDKNVNNISRELLNIEQLIDDDRWEI